MNPFVAVVEIADLSWRQIVRSKQLIGIGLVILFAVGIAFLLQRDSARPGHDPAEDFQFLQLLLLSAVVAPLVSLLFGTGALASERESGTLAFLFTRPIPRWTVLAGKALGAIAGANAAVLLCQLLVWVASGAPSEGEVGGGAVALLLETTALTALFVLFGTVVPKSLYAGLAYIALFEGLAGNTMGARSGWTITYHARKLLAEWSSGAMSPGHPLAGLPGEAGDSVLALLLVTAGALVAAAVWIETREYGLRDRSKED